MSMETLECLPAQPEKANPESIHILHDRIAMLEQRVAQLEQAPAQGIEDRLSMVVFSGELDKVIAALIIATGAASIGLETSMFFTFWGLGVVKKQKLYRDKNLLEKGF